MRRSVHSFVFLLLETQLLFLTPDAASDFTTPNFEIVTPLEAFEPRTQGKVKHLSLEQGKRLACVVRM